MMMLPAVAHLAVLHSGLPGSQPLHHQLLEVVRIGSILISAEASRSRRRRVSRLRPMPPADAAGAQVEDRVLIELADGRPVGALHVVGIDLELRLGVDLRLVGEQQVLVGLLGVGLLGVLVHDRSCR